MCLNLGVFWAFSFDAKSWFALVVGGAFGFVFLCDGECEERVSGFVKALLGVMKFLFVCCALLLEACFVFLHLSFVSGCFLH